jgi:hypothetical protein
MHTTQEKESKTNNNHVAPWLKAMPRTCQDAGHYRVPFLKNGVCGALHLGMLFLTKKPN